MDFSRSESESKTCDLGEQLRVMRGQSGPSEKAGPFSISSWPQTTSKCEREGMIMRERV